MQQLSTANGMNPQRDQSSPGPLNSNYAWSFHISPRMSWNLTILKHTIYSHNFSNAPTNIVQNKIMTTEPQSIIHQVIRLEQKIASSIRRRSSRRRRKTSRTSSDSHTGRSSVSSLDSYFSCTSQEMQGEKDERDDVTVTTFGSSGFLSARRGDESCVSASEGDELTRCMSAESEGLYFIHFHQEGNNLSHNLEKQLKHVCSGSFSGSQYLTIDCSEMSCPKRAGLFPSLSFDKPFVAAVRSGRIINRITSFENDTGAELQPWVSTVEILNMMSWWHFSCKRDSWLKI